MAWYDVSALYGGRPYLYDPATRELQHGRRMQARKPRVVNGSEVHDGGGTTRTCRVLDEHVRGKVATC